MKTKKRSNLVNLLLITVLAITVNRATPSSIGARWTTVIQPPPSTMPYHSATRIANNGNTTVYFGKYPSVLFLLDGNTGEVRWQYRTRGDYLAGLDIAPSGDRVVLMDAKALSPGTEQAIAQMVMLDSDGQPVWAHEAPGAVRISPSGTRILTFNPEVDFGLKVYEASNGDLLWSAPRDDFRKMESAVFTFDAQRILVHALGKVSMFTVVGDLLWAIDFPHAVLSTSTSNDGSITAMLVESVTEKMELTRNLAVVDSTGQKLAGIELLKFKEFEPPEPQIGDWYSVGVSSDGSVIVLEGIAPGVHKLQAVDSSGRVLWSKSFPMSPEGSSASLKMLASGAIAFTVYTNSNTTVYFLDNGGVVRHTAQILGSTIPRFSPNGSFMSAVVDSNVYSFAVPALVAKSLNPTGQKLAASRDSAMRAWITLRHALSTKEWSLDYVPKQREVIARGDDGKRELRLKIGSRKALVNGKKVVLPAAPRIAQSRVQVPDTVLHILAQAIARAM